MTAPTRSANDALIERLVQRFLHIFPAMDDREQRVAVTLYGLLARGGGVTAGQVAEAAGQPLALVQACLTRWPGIFREGEAVVGFWGLAVRPVSRHRMLVDGRTLYTWCAWDTLFIPPLLERSAQVDSTDPVSGAAVTLTVTPQGVQALSPAGAVLSMIEPRANMIEDIRGRLCRYIHFFAEPDAGEAWTRKHADTLLLSVDEGFELGRRRNLSRFADVPSP
ncbi:MAG TPA: organomercurial lyase [bacterium]